MKVPFKTLSLAVAVATAAAGSSLAISQPQLAGNTGLGDMAIVPYYTVRAGWSTGVSIINSSASTQVVKVRFRRGSDSMDAMDFNVVMSPYDHFAGYIALEGDDADGPIRFYSGDNTCTVPAVSALQMPDIYREGADEGYVEIIAMGAALDETQAIAADALHVNDVPVSCARVESNFLKGDGPTDYGPTSSIATGTTKTGVISSVETKQTSASGGNASLNSYVDSDNVLKVSWFIKSDDSGSEIGGEAVHIADLMEGASITNQAAGGGINAGDLQGFDYPDLDGGAPTTAGLAGAAPRGSYQALRSILGASALINDWSRASNDLFSVNTDWVVTVPGQYLMTDLAAYIDLLEVGSDPCKAQPGICHRDIPLTITDSTNAYNREEDQIDVDPGSIVVSPQEPGQVDPVDLKFEVNVIQWGAEPVLGTDRAVSLELPEEWAAGWAELVVAPKLTDQQICGYTIPGLPLTVSCTTASGSAPLVGFAAWERNFGANPDANYGRAVDHSRVVSGS